MKVIALKQGYFGKLRQLGDEFDVPEGSKASWFEPVKPKTEGKKSKEHAADKAGDSLA